MKTWLLAVGLAALIVWEYLPALRGSFVYEDYKLTDACGSVGLEQRLLTRATWCAQVLRSQPPLAFHLVSLGLHLAVTALVGWLAWTLTGESTAALLAAAVFGLNAINVEAVAYLSSRGELVAAIGVLAACLAALTRQWLAVPLALLFGWGGKETAVVGLVLVPLCLWWQRGRPLAWVTALSATVLVTGALIRTATWWEDGPSRLSWALLQATALARLVVLSVLPFGQTVDYDYSHVSAVLPVCALVAAGAWAWRHRANRVLVCGAAWVACAALPRLFVLTPRSVFPEHQFYLPLVGMALIAASLVTDRSLPCR